LKISKSIPAQHRFLLGAVFMGHLANDWVAGTIWIIAPAIAASMGLGPTEVGLILTINGIGAGLSYIPAGMMADRSKRPGLLMLLTFWWVAIGYFLATLVPGFWAITLLLSLGVMGDAFWHPVATGVLVKEMPERRAQALGIHAVGGSIGSEVLGPLSAGFLLGFFDWQTTMQILVIPAIVMGIFFIPMSLRISRESKTVVQSINLKALAKHWVKKTGLGLMLALVFYNMTLMAILSMMPLFLQTDHGLTAFHSGLIFAGFLVIGSLLQPGLGRYTDGRGRRSIVLLVLFLAAAFALFAGLSQGLYWSLLGLFPALVMLTAIRPVLLATAVEYSGQSASTTLGIVFTVMDGVGMVGALFAGLIGEINLAYAFVMAAGFATVAGLIFFQLPDMKKDNIENSVASA
jgi:MFS transporter, FSR family, fosmidomycin resistance protein